MINEVTFAYSLCFKINTRLLGEGICTIFEKSDYAALALFQCNLSVFSTYSTDFTGLLVSINKKGTKESQVLQLSIKEDKKSRRASMVSSSTIS